MAQPQEIGAGTLLTESVHPSSSVKVQERVAIFM